MTDWSKQKVLVTGGCSFIGSHLTEALVQRGATVRVADDLSSGKRENIEILVGDGPGRVPRDRICLSPARPRQAVEGIDQVFHLAANHWRARIHRSAPSRVRHNLALDGLVIRAAHRAGVQQFTFASSACVYPTTLQERSGGDPLPHRGHGRAAVCGGRIVRLGEADDRAHAPGIPPRLRLQLRVARATSRRMASGASRITPWWP